MIPDLTPAEITRFYSKIHLGGCGMQWAGADVNNNGYGRFIIYRDGKRVRILAHRLAYKLATGDDPGPGVIRHGCDTPLCCTPKCLEPGTQADNVRDAVERGRANLDGLHAQRAAAQARVRQRIEAGVKTCARCKITKPLEDFLRQDCSPDKRSTYCTPCRRVQGAIRRQRAKDRRASQATSPEDRDAAARERRRPRRRVQREKPEAPAA